MTTDMQIIKSLNKIADGLQGIGNSAKQLDNSLGAIFNTLKKQNRILDQREGRWTPITKDSLPPVSEIVQLTAALPNNIGHLVFQGFWEDGQFTVFGDIDIEQYEFTAWMPLPEPYKG